MLEFLPSEQDGGAAEARDAGDVLDAAKAVLQREKACHPPPILLVEVGHQPPNGRVDTGLVRVRFDHAGGAGAERERRGHGTGDQQAVTPT